MSEISTVDLAWYLLLVSFMETTAEKLWKVRHLCPETGWTWQGWARVAGLWETRLFKTKSGDRLRRRPSHFKAKPVLLSWIAAGLLVRIGERRFKTVSPNAAFAGAIAGKIPRGPKRRMEDAHEELPLLPFPMGNARTAAQGHGGGSSGHGK